METVWLVYGYYNFDTWNISFHKTESGAKKKHAEEVAKQEKLDYFDRSSVFVVEIKLKD